MKTVIFALHDSNIAGFEWTHTFRLNRLKNKSMTLSHKNTVNEGDAWRLRARRGLKDGVDVYEALQQQLIELGYELFDYDVESIAPRLVAFGAQIGDEFRRAPETIEERDARECEQEQRRRKAAVAPFAEAIELYVQQYSDDKLFYPGAGYTYPSKRHWARRFLEQCVWEHGALPTGIHQIPFSASGSGPEHDFSDLG